MSSVSPVQNTTFGAPSGRSWLSSSSELRNSQLTTTQQNSSPFWTFVSSFPDTFGSRNLRVMSASQAENGRKWNFSQKPKVEKNSFELNNSLIQTFNYRRSLRSQIRMIEIRLRSDWESRSKEWESEILNSTQLIKTHQTHELGELGISDSDDWDPIENPSSRSKEWESEILNSTQLIKTHHYFEEIWVQARTLLDPKFARHVRG